MCSTNLNWIIRGKFQNTRISYRIGNKLYNTVYCSTNTVNANRMRRTNFDGINESILYIELYK